MTWRFVEYYYERLVKLFQIECVDDTYDMRKKQLNMYNLITFSDK